MFFMMTTQQLAATLASEMVSQMSDADRAGFDRDSWRDGVANNISASGPDYRDVRTDEVLTAIETAIRG